MSTTIPPNCYPVIGVRPFNNKEICIQDFTVEPVPLTEKSEGTISCLLFRNGKCKGEMPCIIKAVYPEIKMVGPE